MDFHVVRVCTYDLVKIILRVASLSTLVLRGFFETKDDMFFLRIVLEGYGAIPTKTRRTLFCVQFVFLSSLTYLERGSCAKEIDIL
mmetsp:Transcript_12551/g.24322  ORF Transcript_12551/g.24322 Transcript_12551/m.24322 type:complete len:86 (+) Transcript_12551:970-1227(+)